MTKSVNAGARLDRLPVGSFHYGIFWLVGAGMFFDGYDLYVGTNVLPAALQSGFSTPALNADFISKTFLGMTIGALDHGLPRRSVRAAFHLSDQSGDLRARFAGGVIGARHDDAELASLRDGARARRRNRGRLFDADGIRPAPVARALALLHGLSGRLGPAGHGIARLSDHPGLGLAADVRHRRRRGADRLVAAQEPAGIAALAGVPGAQRGG